MDLETFRTNAHRVVDRMADYQAGIERLPVRSQVQPGEIAALLPEAAPERGEAFDAIMADMERIVLPGLTHWQHPRFFAYFPANASPPAILAEMLTAAFGTQGMLWQTSPAATELETRVLDWLRQLIGLPDGFHGVIQDSASSATLVRRPHGARARHRLAIRRGGPRRDAATCRLRLGRGAQLDREGGPHRRAGPPGAAARAHRRARGACARTRWPTDRADRADGIVPACVVACFGSTGLGASIRWPRSAPSAASEGIYLHVDAAWAGSALLLPEVRALGRAASSGPTVSSSTRTSGC